jgi:hypothetical protein
MGFAIGRQNRPRFVFAETRPETGTSQKTLEKTGLVGDLGGRSLPLRELLRSRSYVKGEPASGGIMKDS